MVKRLTAVLAFLVMAGPVWADDKTSSIESYKAQAIVQTQGMGSIFEIDIFRWSGDEEHEQLVEAVRRSTVDPAENPRGVAKALRELEKVGYVFFTGRQTYPLRYARSFDQGGGRRQLILLTDRPVSSQESYQRTPLGSLDVLSDFDTTMVVLNVDENGKGDGLWLAGTELKWNDELGKIGMTNTSSQPVKLGDVRPQKK